MSQIFAYCRVSTDQQDTGMQEQAITARYPTAIVRSEKATGRKADKQTRPVLDLLLQMLAKGDQLVVWRLDRLGRSIEDLSGLVRRIEERGAALVVLDQNIDTRSVSGKAFLNMLGVFAEFEADLRKERQLAGIAKAKAEGKHLGRPATIKREKVQKLLSEGKTPTEVADELGIGRASVYRAMKTAAQP